jgi:hypothetical protein
LGRQAYTLGESDLAVAHFLRLLRKDETGEPGSQGMVLEDLALAYEVRGVPVALRGCKLIYLQQLAAHPEQLAAAKDKLSLVIPVFDIGATKILTSTSQASSSGSRDRWSDLEATALSGWDRKGKKPMNLLPDDKRIQASVGG